MPAIQMLYAGAGDNIAIYARSEATGDLTLAQTVPVAGGVRAFCLSPNLHHMHVATADDKAITLTVDQSTGSLQAEKGAPVPLPISPCYMTTDRSGRFVLFASYRVPGAATVLAIAPNGSITGPPVCMLDDLRSTSHFIGTDPSNRFAYVPCVAAADHTNGNAIHQLHFDAATGKLSHNGLPIIPPPTGPTPSPRFDGPIDVKEEPEGGFPEGFSAESAPPPYNRFGTRPELGPRHFVFHPFLPILYTANEQGNSVSAYKMDSTSGLLAHIETLPTVPDGFSKMSHCAEIKFSPDGRWLLAPNRALPETGGCSVAVFAVDTTGGLRLSEMCMVTDVPANFSPQHIVVDPSGRFVYVGDGGFLCQFYLDPNHGKLVRMKDYGCGGADGSQTGGYLAVNLSGASL